jgi:hypothetical protein
MYHPKTLSKMAELKRQDTHRNLSRRQYSKNSQPEQPVIDIIQNISGLVQRLIAPLTLDRANNSHTSKNGKQAFSG